MNKKFTIMILLMILFIATGCNNQNVSEQSNKSQLPATKKFAIHSDVEFGMSPDEIKSLEEKAGFEIETAEISSKLYADVEDKNYLLLKGKIASIEKSRIEYYFKENNMNIAEYVLGYPAIGNPNNKTKEEIYNDYNTIQESLVQRYGQPTGASINIHTLKYNYDSNTAPDGIFFESCDIDKANSWFIKTEDGYIIIDHYVHSSKFTKSMMDAGARKDYPDGYETSHRVVYQKYALDDPDIINTLSNLGENEKQLSNDL